MLLYIAQVGPLYYAVVCIISTKTGSDTLILPSSSHTCIHLPPSPIAPPTSSVGHRPTWQNSDNMSLVCSNPPRQPWQGVIYTWPSDSRGGRPGSHEASSGPASHTYPYQSSILQRPVVYTNGTFPKRDQGAWETDSGRTQGCRLPRMRISLSMHRVALTSLSIGQSAPTGEPTKGPSSTRRATSLLLLPRVLSSA